MRIHGGKYAVGVVAGAFSILLILSLLSFGRKSPPENQSGETQSPSAAAPAATVPPDPAKPAPAEEAAPSHPAPAPVAAGRVDIAPVAPPTPAPIDASRSLPAASDAQLLPPAAEASQTVLPENEAPAALTTEQIVQRSEQSVARIKGRFSGGAGFLVKPNLLVTNAHLVQDEFIEHLEIYFPSAAGANRGPLKASLVYEDRGRDVALLSVSSPLPALHVAESYEFKRGQDVIIIGSPAAGDDLLLENAIARGVMSTKTTIREHCYYQLGVSVNPGNSGGPVLDQQGHVIGIVTSKAARQEGLAFSIPPEDVNEAINAAASQTVEERSRAAAWHRAVTAFRAVQVCGAIYAEGLSRYAGAMEQAVRQGGQPNDGIRQASATIDQGIAAADGTFSPDLARFISTVSSDRQLDAPIREQIVELWTTYKQMKGCFDRPKGTYDEYRSRIAELAEKHRLLSDKPQVLLGVEDLIQIAFTNG